MAYTCDQCAAPLPPGSLFCPKCGRKFPQPVPGSPAPHLSSPAPQRRLPKPLTVGLWLFAAVIVLGLIGNATSPTPPALPAKAAVAAPAPPQGRTQAEDAAPPSSNPFGLKPGMRVVYSVYKEDNKTIDGNFHAGLSIILPLGLSREAVDQNLRYAARAEYTKLTDSNHRPDAMRIWAFRKGGDMESGDNVGMCEFAPHGDYIASAAGVPLDQFQMKVEMDNAYFAMPPKADASVAGISEARRHTIAFALAKVDADADNAANREIPTDNLDEGQNLSKDWMLKQMKANRDLEDKLDTERTKVVCRRYGITPDQADKIQGEAMMKSWPVYHDESH